LDAQGEPGGHGHGAGPGPGELFRRAFEASPEAIVVLGADGRVRLANAAAERLVGFPRESLVGRHYSEGWRLSTLDGEEVPPESKPAARALAGEVVLDFDAFVESGPRRVCMSISAAPLRGPGGGAIVTFHDVSARRNDQRGQLAREKLLRAEADEARLRQQFLAEASAALAASLDVEAALATLVRLAVPRIADWALVDLVDENGSIRQAAAAHRDPAMAELVRDLGRRYPWPPAGAEGVPKVIRTGAPAILPLVSDELLGTIAQGGDHRDLLVSLGLRSAIIVPLAARGRTFGAITLASAGSGRMFGPLDLAVADDLAHRASLAIDNARLYAEAQLAVRVRDDFLATVSHELRTPLTAMLGWARLLRGEKLDPALAARAVETIERNAKAQAQLVDDLLDVSRITSGKLRLRAGAVDLPGIVQSALESVRVAAEAKSLEVSVACDPELPPIAGDPDRIQQIVWNILSNAIKFTPSGGRVDVRVEGGPGAVRISVADTGRGISPGFLPYVFERFRQADSTTTRAHGGLGLGLAIVRHLVELHGGTVRAESAGEGRGATFTVELPARPGAGAGGGREAHGLAGGQERARAEGDALAGVRVLLVEDDADGRELIAYMLRSAGAEVRAVESAAAAIDALDAAPPDVIVSDIGMAGEDGYALIRRVRARRRDRGGAIPAIALTAFAAPEDRARALAAGYQVHIPKPVMPGDLAGAIRGVLGAGKRGA
jgi:PAS domain S-box-containing protein